jgi:hypothetical protein
VTPSPARNANFEPRIHADANGALKNPRHERMAMMMAEGFNDLETWKACSESLTKEARKYGRRIFANETFKERVVTLMTEKEEIERDPVWGRAKWAVNQLWRQAMADQDTATMKEAAKMQLTIAEKSAPEPEPGGAPNAAAKTPGRPPADSAQTKRLDPDAIRQKLMGVNRTAPPGALDADTEVDGEA